MNRLYGTENDAMALIEKHFKYRIHGDPAAVSQFGKPYVVWANGHIMTEGQFTPSTKLVPMELLETLDAWLSVQALAADVIVMRRAPICEQWLDHEVLGPDDGPVLRTRLSLRCHFMKKEDL